MLLSHTKTLLNLKADLGSSSNVTLTLFLTS